jgi:hypothetical protein
MKKLFYILTVLFVTSAMLLSACGEDTPPLPATQDPAIAALQAQLEDIAGDFQNLEDENADLREQLEEALKTPEEPEEPDPTATPTYVEPKYRCGAFVMEGKIYQVRKNRRDIIQRNDSGKYLPDVLGKNQVEWFYKGQRTCVWKKWTQFDGGRMWKLWYNTWHRPTGTWLSHPVDCCYVSFNAFKPDDATYMLPIELE